jgi:large subunit ribosomal protein L10
MENPRPEKVAVVTEVRERLESSSAVLLTEYRGLKVGELADLRRALRTAGGDYKIYKNTLVRFAVRDLGLEGVEELLVGPTALAFVDGDAAAVAKALRDFGRTNPNLVLKGGVLGNKALTADEARSLAELPSREVLLARFAGLLAAPLQQFAGLLQALPRNTAYGLHALIDQKVAGGEAAAPAAEPEPEPEAEAPAAEAPAAGAEAAEVPTAEAAAPEVDGPAEPDAAAAPAAEETTESEPEAEAPVAEAEPEATDATPDATPEPETAEEA